MDQTGMTDGATVCCDPRFYDQLAESYDRVRGLLPESAARQVASLIVELVGATADTAFIEPGTGTGRIALPLVQRGYRWTGVDASPRMLERFQAKVGHSPARLRLVCADTVALPFDRPAFEVALTASVLYLIPDWRRALEEIRRVLRPGGYYLYCDEPAEGNDVARQVAAQWHTLVARSGFASAWHSYCTRQDVFDYLEGRGARIDPPRTVSWRDAQSLDAYLAGYETRLRPLYSQIPTNLFSTLTQALHDWARERYDLATTTLSYQMTFAIYLVRHWSAGPDRIDRG